MKKEKKRETDKAKDKTEKIAEMKNEDVEKIGVNPRCQ